MHAIVVPEVGESIHEVQIVRWLKQEGEEAAKDEPLVELETDKATVELPSPAAGVLAKILKHDGETAEVGAVIGQLDEETQKEQAKAAPSKTTTKPQPGAATAERSEPAAAPPKKPRPAVAPADKTDGRERAKPSVHAAERTPPPSPPPETPLSAEPAEPSLQAPQRPSPKPRAAAPPTQQPAPAVRPAAPSLRQEETLPMSPIRRRIAERLVEAQQTAALLTTFNEIDMSAVIRLRQEHREAFQDRYGAKLGFMSFFVKAAIEGLKLVPELNAEIRDASIVYRNYYDVGIAIGGGKALVVPVLRNAERMSFGEIERAIADFAARAGANKLKPEDLEGGTFTITNGGIYGSLLSTPIVNPPQNGILGMHAIQDRPVARNGQVVIRPMMYVALTYDHRAVDGREAVGFLRRVKEIIEEPARLLLEI